MHILYLLFGEGKSLNTLQMCDRGLVIFILSLVLIRISGRRSFGLRTPLDNIIAILLGAVLSRAVVGASPFVPVVATCLLIVLLHRVFGWLIPLGYRLIRWLEGEKILLYADGNFLDVHLRRALVSREDVMQGIRKVALTEDMEQIDKVYMERNGVTTAIRKPTRS